MTGQRPTVVLLISDKRSGSTMVQDEFCKHPDVGRVGYTPHSRFETQHWLTGAALLGLPDALFSGGKTYSTYRSSWVARTYLVDMLKGNVPGFIPPADDHALVFDGWEALCAQYARPVFFEKSPQHLANWAALSLLLEWRERTAFTVKFLFLVRNPLAVQHSAEQLFGTPPDNRQFGWLEAHRNLLALRTLLPPEETLTLRYEDIVADPPASFAKIFAFAGLEPHEASGSGIHARSAEKWRNDRDFTLVLDPAVVQIARSLGYSAAELENPYGQSRQPGPLETAWTGYRRLVSWVRNGFLKPILLSLCGKRH